MPSRTTATLGVLAATVSASLALVPVAQAEQNPSSAFALSARGLLTVEPLPHLDSSAGYQERSVADVGVPLNLVRVGALTSAVGEGHARASVTDLRVGLGEVSLLDLGLADLNADVITAQCENGQGSSTVVGASLGGVALEAGAGPNTGVQVPGIAEVLLNKQVENEDGTLTVTALSIRVAGLQTIDVASATCGDAGNTGPGPEEPGEGGQTPEPPGEENPGERPDGGSSGPGDPEGGGERPGGAGPSDPGPGGGHAPRPTPVPGHHPVTG
ncbi:choice-of-anchor P family protein [Actinoalloteichus spitiensis]|uniref:choice-of-anchor P family protein n=1 Tax=Actinoalloteichus spitiensis TaxID=252394 RepID=UPI00035FC5A8|nr:choice-of-anchor P family protein [Actinoalloteichus spitiensis]